MSRRSRSARVGDSAFLSVDRLAKPLNLKMMNNFLFVDFGLYESYYHSLILCKNGSDGIEYRITVMNGEIEKHLCRNNRLTEQNGCVVLELSGNAVQDEIKLIIAMALCNHVGKPLKQIICHNQIVKK